MIISQEKTRTALTRKTRKNYITRKTNLITMGLLFFNGNFSIFANRNRSSPHSKMAFVVPGIEDVDLEFIHRGETASCNHKRENGKTSSIIPKKFNKKGENLNKKLNRTADLEIQSEFLAFTLCSLMQNANNNVDKTKAMK